MYIVILKPTTFHSSKQFIINPPYPPISWGKCWLYLIKLADSKRLFKKTSEVLCFVRLPHC